MGGIGAGGLIPFGGNVPHSQEADEETKHDHEHPSFEEGVKEDHVTGVDPIPPTLNHPENLEAAEEIEGRGNRLQAERAQQQD